MKIHNVITTTYVAGSPWNSCSSKITFFVKNENCLDYRAQPECKVVILWKIEAVFACYGALCMFNGRSPGVNSVSRPHLLIISSNFIRHSFPKNKIISLKVIYNNPKRHIWENLSSI